MILIEILLMTIFSLAILERIQWLIVEVKGNVFNFKVETILKDYLSCHGIDDKELNQIMILQPHSISNLLNEMAIM
jgi:hypothetical protein